MRIATDAAMGSDASYGEDLFAALKNIAQGHELIHVNAGESLGNAEAFLGQPTIKQIKQAPELRWVQVTSAGITRFDTAEFRDYAISRKLILTNSSSVYDKPCAQHLAALMFAHARCLPDAFAYQQRGQWEGTFSRRKSVLLTGQKVLIYGYGAIARELIRLLAPLNMQFVGVRRNPQSQEATRVVNLSQGDDLLSWADHIINILPANADSHHYFNHKRLSKISPHAVFYNIGRGTTVDQSALITLLQAEKIGMAYLDVVDPEPLPPEHPLWHTPRCVITSHCAGGFKGESRALAEHFGENLNLYTQSLPLKNRIY